MESFRAFFAAAIIMLLGVFCSSASAECVFERQTKVGKELNLPIHSWSDDRFESPRAIIVAVPGLIFSGLAYESLGRYFSERNYPVYTIDLRGFGEWRHDAEKYGADKAIHFTQSKEDISRMLEVLRRDNPGIPIFCLGESIGANYALWQASTKPELIDGAILVNVSYKVCVHPRPLWVKTFFQGLSHPKRPLDLVPYLQPLLSDNKALVKNCLSDSETTTVMSVEDLIKAAVTNRRTVQQLDKIPESMPILIVAGQKDRIQKTNKLPDMVSRMSSKKTELVVLHNKGHLLVEHQKVNLEITKILDDWLDKCTNDATPSMHVSKL